MALQERVASADGDGQLHGALSRPHEIAVRGLVVATSHFASTFYKNCASLCPLLWGAASEQAGGTQNIGEAQALPPLDFFNFDQTHHSAQRTG